MSRAVLRLHWLLLLPLLVLAALAGRPVGAVPAAAAPITLVARPAYEGIFRPGSWLPIIVELENTGVDRTVEVRVAARSGAQYGTVVELPNRGRKLVTVYVYLTPASRRLNVQVLHEGQELGSQRIELPPANPRAHVVAVVTGDAPPVRLPTSGDLVAPTLRLADLPAHSLGLSGFDTLLLTDGVTSGLSAAQRVALTEWVQRGGQLMLAGGPELQRTLAGLPLALRPVAVTNDEPVAASVLFGESASGAAPVPVARLAPQAGDGAPAPYAIPLPPPLAGSGLALEQSVGRGVVTVLGLPLSHPAVVGWADMPLLWERILRPRAELPPGFVPEALNLDAFVEGNLAASLTSLPALELPPLDLLAGLVCAYIVLVGPGTYLVLRRFDRQALGWIVVPLLTLLFAALTYAVGYRQRGGDVVLNTVTLVEPLDERGTAARLRSFVGMFSPERRSYTLRSDAADTPAPLLRPLSIQGPWDTSSSDGGLFLQDLAGGAEARDVEVVQWSMRAFASDVITGDVGLRTRLVIDGDQLIGEVENRGAYELIDVTLVQGDQLVRLGDLAPGEARRGALTRRQVNQPGMFGPTLPMSYLLYGEEMERLSRSGGQPLPPELQQRVRIIDALYSYGPPVRSGQPVLIAWAHAPGVQLQPETVRADTQQTMLFSATPQIALAGAETSLPPGWLAPRIESDAAAACFGGMGMGLLPQLEPGVLQLLLPRDLYGFRPAELTLLTSSDGPWPDDLQVELYDWGSASWETQQLRQRAQAVAEPERFLSSHGMLRVRLRSERGLANAGCVYVDARLRGTMP